MASGLPDWVSDEEIRLAANAREAKRITKKRDGQVVSTMAVLLVYGINDVVPHKWCSTNWPVR